MTLLGHVSQGSVRNNVFHARPLRYVIRIQTGFRVLTCPEGMCHWVGAQNPRPQGQVSSSRRREWSCHQHPGRWAQGTKCCRGDGFGCTFPPHRSPAKGKTGLLVRACAILRIVLFFFSLFIFPDPSSSVGPKKCHQWSLIPMQVACPVVLWERFSAQRGVLFPGAPGLSPACASGVQALTTTLREMCSTYRPFQKEKKPRAITFSSSNNNLNGPSSRLGCTYMLSSRSPDPGHH